MSDPYVEQLAVMRTSSTDILIVTLETNRGRRKVNLRRWLNSGIDSELRPAKDGIAVPSEALDRLIAALTMARVKLGGGAL